jgi:hypothetical protein
LENHRVLKETFFFLGDDLGVCLPFFFSLSHHRITPPVGSRDATYPDFS